jgi:hypothetical protein
MSVFLLRLLTAFLGFLVLVLLAAAGLVVALFCLGGGTATLSLAHLAELLALDDLRDTVGGWLGSLEADGPAAALAALCGAGVILLGIGLLIGALVPTRERLLVIERDDRGSLGARRRAAASALSTLAERPRDILKAKARVRPNRNRAGGRARLTLVHADRDDERQAAERSRAQLAELAEGMSLRLQRRLKRPRRGGRAL